MVAGILKIQRSVNGQHTAIIDTTIDRSERVLATQRLRLLARLVYQNVWYRSAAYVCAALLGTAVQSNVSRRLLV